MGAMAFISMSLIREDGWAMALAASLEEAHGRAYNCGAPWLALAVRADHPRDAPNI
jgi:hypothetical protein